MFQAIANSAWPKFTWDWLKQGGRVWFGPHVKFWKSWMLCPSGGRGMWPVDSLKARVCDMGGDTDYGMGSCHSFEGAIYAGRYKQVFTLTFFWLLLQIPD